MNRIHKLATYLLIGTLTFTGKEAFALATVDTTTGIDILTGEEPVAGIELALNELFESSEDAESTISSYLTTKSDSEYDNLAFAQVTDYVNIRNEASENGEILGKLYNHSAATIVDEKDGWYQITSGSVKGYIKADFLVTGEKATTLAKTLGTKMATVTTTTLKVREKASLDAEVLTLVPEGDELKVIKQQDDWVKVALGQNEYGYVSSDYVTIQTEYEEAVSIEEEQESIREEAAATQAENDNNGSSTKSSTGNSSSNNQSTVVETDNSSDSSGLGSRLAAYAVQFEGNPYVWGGTSLTNGADCSGFTQSVFAHFGISIPRTSRTQAAGGNRVSLDNLKAGDLIFYTNNGSINHVALYIGNGKVISASSPSTGIRITRYNYRQPYKAVSYIN